MGTIILYFKVGFFSFCAADISLLDHELLFTYLTAFSEAVLASVKALTANLYAFKTLSDVVVSPPVPPDVPPDLLPSSAKVHVWLLYQSDDVANYKVFQFPIPSFPLSFTLERHPLSLSFSSLIP